MIFEFVLDVTRRGKSAPHINHRDFSGLAELYRANDEFGQEHRLFQFGGRAKEGGDDFPAGIRRSRRKENAGDAAWRNNCFSGVSSLRTAFRILNAICPQDVEAADNLEQ